MKEKFKDSCSGCPFSIAYFFIIQKCANAQKIVMNIAEIRIYPLSFAEFYNVYDGDYDDAWNEYMTYGGLPQVVQFSGEQQKAEYLKNMFANVYIRDVVERNKIQNVDEIGTLVDILASAIGALTNPTKISNTFRSERGSNYSNKTISNHIDYLAEAFLISKANRYDIKGRKYVGANLKYYFIDVGLRNARLNFRQQESTHIMENIVYNELLVRGYNVDVGIVDAFAKNKEGKRVHKQLEVDFVVNQGSQRYYIQVACDMTSEEKQTQELYPRLRAACAQNPAAWENALVSAAGICYPQGTKHGTYQKKRWQCENKNKYGQRSGGDRNIHHLPQPDAGYRKNHCDAADDGFEADRDKGRGNLAFGCRGGALYRYGG